MKKDHDSQDKTVTLTGEGINFFQLARLKGMLALECKGLKMSRGGPTALSQLRALGYKGNRKKVLEQVERDVESAIRENRTGEI